MLESMRKPVFVIAFIIMGLTVLVELSSIALVKNVSSASGALDISITGQAIPSMSILDGLIFYAIAVMAIALLLPERFQSKIQGIVTILVGLVLLFACIVRFFIDIQLLFTMIGLLLAIPFGTLVYLAVWGDFATGSAQAALSLIMFLKIAFSVCLVIAQQRFLKNKGLVLIILTSFLANIIIAFLYGLVPTFLVHILDEVAALIVCILAGVWIVIYLIGGVISTITAFI